MPQALSSNLTFSPHSGFNGVGPPRAFRAQLDLPLLAAGMGVTPAAAEGRYNRSTMVARNDWRFAGAAIDQGLVFFLLYLRRSLGTWTSPACSW